MCKVFLKTPVNSKESEQWRVDSFPRKSLINESLGKECVCTDNKTVPRAQRQKSSAKAAAAFSLMVEG
jgi:hypothetical protein